VSAAFLGGRLDLYLISERTSPEEHAGEAVYQAEERKVYVPGGVAVVSMAHLSPLVWSVQRHPLGAADEVEVTLLPGSIPGDLDVIDDIQFDLWTFTHGDPGRCKRGDPGHVGGRIDDIDSNAKETKIKGRDYTALLIDREVPAVALDSVNLEGDLASVVRALVDLAPGCAAWHILARGRIAKTVDTGTLLVDERKSAKWKARKTRRRSVVNVKDASGAATIGDIVGTSGKLNIWDAIVRVCSFCSVIPEVSLTQDGDVAVVLVDAFERYDGATVRTFSREDLDIGETRDWRLATYGKTLEDAPDTHRSLRPPGAAPSYVVVTSADPRTGAVKRSVYGTPTAKPRKGKKSLGVLVDAYGNTFGANAKPGELVFDGAGVVMVAPGVTDTAELDSMARAAWVDMHLGEKGVQLTFNQPWTDGGSGDWPDGPDLLFCAAGALMEVSSVFEERANGAYENLEDIFRAQGMSDQDAKTWADVHKARGRATVYTVGSLAYVVDAADGSFRANVDLVGFVRRTEDPKVLSSEDGALSTDDVWEDL